MRNMTKTFANSNNMSIHDNDNGGGVSEELEESTNKKRIAQTLVDLAVIALVFIIFGLVYGFVDPKIRYLTCDDPDIVFPFLEDTIPFWAAGIFASIGPLLFILLVELLNAKLLPMQMNRDNLNFEKRKRKFLICLFHGWSLFVLGCAITLLLTEIGKKWVGRLRPHFLDVCKPDFNKITCSGSSASGQDRYLAINTGLYNGASFCTGDAKKIKEARVSFPSGHSSFSWYSMVFLIIYLEARWFLLRLRYIKPLIQMAGFIAAFVTCLSRISDYHHRGSDVVGGTVLGIVIAYFITYYVGRVIWEYEVESPYSDFDLKPSRRVAANRSNASGLTRV